VNHTYDYVIVGAGSAGCILANRLTEGGKYSVLLLEAGGPDDSLRFKVPIGYVYTIMTAESNWMYSLQPEKELKQSHALLSPRQGSRWQRLDQCLDLRPRAKERLRRLGGAGQYGLVVRRRVAILQAARVTSAR